jgi:hypothetical protein
MSALQLYSLVQQRDNILQFKNAFINLGLPLFLITESFPKKVNKDSVMYGNIVQKAIPDGWSVWDMIEINGPLTIDQFIIYFKDKYNITILSIKDHETEVIKNTDEIEK